MFVPILPSNHRICPERNEVDLCEKSCGVLIVRHRFWGRLHDRPKMAAQYFGVFRKVMLLRIILVYNIDIPVV